MKKLVVVLAVSLAWAGLAWAEETAAPAAAPEAQAAAPAAEVAAPASDGVEAVESAIASGIENRQPVGAAEKFPAAAGKVYCYTKIAGAQAGSEIVHKWLKGTEVMAEVTLKIGGSPWRVYSSKTLVPESVGAWSVEVSQDGKLVKKLEFTVE